MVTPRLVADIAQLWQQDIRSVDQSLHASDEDGLVSNMPHLGLHVRLSEADSFNDGLLDVLFFTDLSKLDLLGYVFQGVAGASRKTPASNTTRCAGWILKPILPCR